MAEVRGDHGAIEPSRKTDGKVSSSRTAIQAKRWVGISKQVPNFSDGHVSPVTVDRCRKEMIQEIVPMGDAREHFLNATAIRPPVLPARVSAAAHE
jgi:hypothetical protein